MNQKNLIKQLRTEHRLENVRWTRPENLHVTLRFIGNTPVDKTQELSENIKQELKEIKSFESELATTKVFPSEQKPRVIIIDFKKYEKWTPLATALENAAVNSGFPKEERSFHPHLTIGRNPKGIIKIPESIKVSENIILEINEVTLFSSKTYPEGAVYEVIDRFPLI